MVPVGRLTLLRTFAKSDLLRMMSFVSMPALVAPMGGPLIFASKSDGRNTAHFPVFFETPSVT
jgi:hypothetical protein